MSCTSPVQGYRGRGGRFVVDSRKSDGSVPMEVPCGRCMSCRIAKKSEWGLRGAHELADHGGVGAFLTLTFDEVHVPGDMSVSVRHLQLFMKLLRFRLSRLDPPVRVRFIASGEYGDQTRRPHYHVVVFGFDFPDRVACGRNERGEFLYQSKLLGELWPHGSHQIGAATNDSVAYTAGYTCKKITGPLAEAHYQRLNPVTGEIHQVRPEFLVCSNRPGIGANWARRFQCDYVDSGFVVHQGVKRPVPKYYRGLVRRSVVDDEVVLPSEVQAKEAGLRKRKLHPEEQTEARRDVRAEVVRLRVAERGRGRGIV